MEEVHRAFGWLGLAWAGFAHVLHVCCLPIRLLISMARVHESLLSFLMKSVFCFFLCFFFRDTRLLSDPVSGATNCIFNRTEMSVSYQKMSRILYVAIQKYVILRFESTVGG